MIKNDETVINEIKQEDDIKIEKNKKKIMEERMQFVDESQSSEDINSVRNEDIDDLDVDENQKKTKNNYNIQLNKDIEMNENEENLDHHNIGEHECEVDFLAWISQNSDKYNTSINLWKDLEFSTNFQINKLTEQLKIALEPNKMTKLKGNYKSGKRLNMKKIIPFIASNFRKDKIWLRRT